MRKRTLFGLVVLASAAAALAALIRVNTTPEAFIDLDGDGFVSPREAFASRELGQRPVERDGRRCNEIYALSTDETIRIVCALSGPTG